MKYLIHLKANGEPGNKIVKVSEGMINCTVVVQLTFII